jgi:tetratricopeptide (TPR) repeat protein
MRNFAGALAGVVLVLASAGAVSAGPDQDCLTLKDKAARIRACTEVIDGRYDAQQKAQAFRMRGRARADAGALKDALSDLDQALRLKPGDAAALAARAQVHLAQNDIELALSDLNAALKADANDPDLFLLRGHAHLVSGDADKAIDDFSAVLAIRPESASALNNRGLAFRKKGNVDRAIADYTAAIAVAPLYALAFDNRGRAYEAKGRKDDAVADFRRALLIDPGLAGAREGLRRLGESDGGAESRAYVQAGQDLVQKNCGWCHATARKGESPNVKAPPFRDIQARHPLLALREPLSRGIAAPHDQMPKFAFSEREVDQIVAYINSLGHADAP